MTFPLFSFLTRSLKKSFPQQILGFLFGIIEKVVGNKDEAKRINSKIQALAEENQLNEIHEISKIVLAEIKSENWLQKSWRPIVMLSLIGVIVNTYLIIPYLNMFLPSKIILPLPESFFDLLTFGVGGYIIGRSFEKGIKIWKNDGLY